MEFKKNIINTEYVKVQKVNAVLFGKSDKKGTPFIKLLCTDSEGNNLSWTGWYTARNEQYLRADLASFKFDGEISEIMREEDSSKRATFFGAPSQDVLVEEEEYEDKEGNTKTVRKIASVNNPKTKISDGEVTKDVEDAWGKFDKKTKLEDGSDIPF